MPKWSSTLQTGTDKGGNPVYTTTQHGYKKDPTLRKRRRRSPRNLQILPASQDELALERGPASIGGYEVLSGETAASTMGDIPSEFPELTTQSEEQRPPESPKQPPMGRTAPPPPPPNTGAYYNRLNLGTLQRRKKREMDVGSDALSELDPQKLRMLKQLLIAITQGGR